MESSTQKSPPTHRPVAERFQVKRLTLWLDKLMTGTIITGGISVILAVLGIFFFIFAEALPLFQKAKVQTSSQSTKALPTKAILGLQEDFCFVYEEGKDLLLVPQKEEGVEQVPAQRLKLPLPEGEQVTSALYKPALRSLALGFASGKVALLEIGGQGDERSHSSFIKKPAEGRTLPTLQLSELLAMQEEGSVGAIEKIAFAEGSDKKVFATLSHKEGKPCLSVLVLEKSRSLLEEEKWEATGFYDLSSTLKETPQEVLVNTAGNGLVIQEGSRHLVYYEFDGDSEEWHRIQEFAPLGEGQEVLSSVNWVFGELSLVLGGSEGSLSVWSLYPQENEQGIKRRLFGQTKVFEPMEGSVNLFSASSLNRSFFVASEKEVRLCYSTTADIRWQEKNLSFVPIHMATSEHFDTLVLQNNEGKLFYYGVKDPHPEAGVQALLGKVWYEGYESPSWQWQSVGGTDDYESKISLVPLIFGTVKGTFYALLFAIPIAVLAAIYTAQFMSARVKRVVKPLMEIMASLPSVVLGFFGALYLAPKMEDKVPAFLLMFALICLATTALGWFWVTRSVALRNRFKGGFEYGVMMPVVFLICWFSWSYGGDWIEPYLVKGLCFSHEIFGGEALKVVTFPEFWRQGFELSYEQRNSLVVGFIMGFAVIPLIFTISEDALSNVSPSLIAASEALGASRWQIVRTLVLPIASAGIFSALMIGVGRAVGETMIVLMATGNTPLMDVNIFNGMRTLSANIATELPEAAQHSTHYRVLFLGGLLLFMMTFGLNTMAEILRHRLREKFKVQ